MVSFFFFLAGAFVDTGTGYDQNVFEDIKTGSIYEYSIFHLADVCGLLKYWYLVAESLEKRGLSE